MKKRITAGQRITAKRLGCSPEDIAGIDKEDAARIDRAIRMAVRAERAMCVAMLTVHCNRIMQNLPGYSATFNDQWRECVLSFQRLAWRMEQERGTQ